MKCIAIKAAMVCAPYCCRGLIGLQGFMASL